MESVKQSAKRKKRRTRRSLNEIKKRCNRAMINNNPLEYNACKNDHATNNNCFVTTNRLTLFNKAVQSETVTRKHLYSLVNEKSKKCNIKKHMPPEQAHILEHAENEVSKTTLNLDDDTENNSIKSGRNIHSPNNIISSSSQEMMSCLPNKSSPDPQLAFDLYVEFMKSIPNCLIKLVPEYHINDLMSENKKFLQKQLETIDNQNIQLQSEREYLNMNNQYMSMNQTLNTTMSYIARNESIELDPSSSRSYSTNSNTSDHLSAPNSPVSPEYTYYPHRLNQ